MVDYHAALPLGIAIGVGIIAFAYMLSQLIQSEGLRAYAKMELGELVLSVILVLICLAAFDTGASEIANVLHISTPQFGVAEAGTALHQNLEIPLQNALDNMVKDSFRLTKIIGYNYNGQLALPFVSGIYSSAPGAGASPLMMQLQTGMDTTSMTLLLVRAVRVGALFLDWAVQFLLMPLGVLLRFIPPCRRVGGLLLGVGLAVHLAFPASVGLSLELGSQFLPTQSVYVMPDPGDVYLKDVICSPWMQGMYTAGEFIIPTIVDEVICTLQLVTVPGSWAWCPGNAGDPTPIGSRGFAGLMSTIWYFFDLVFQGLSSVMLMNAPINMDPGQIGAIYHDSNHPGQDLSTGVLPVVVDLNLCAIILIVIILAATIILAREFAMVLGGEGQFYGLAKLV